MARPSVSWIKCLSYSLAFLLLSATAAPAAGIPGGDFRALAYDKGAGHALLSRYELFISKDGDSWTQAHLDVPGDEFICIAGEKKSFLIGTRKGRIIRFSPGKEPIELPTVKDPFGRVVEPVRMIGVSPDSGAILISSGQGAMLSKNSGETFEPLSDPFWNDAASREIRALGYLGKTALVVTRGGIYYSSGDQFQISNAGLPAGASPSAVFIEGGRALSAFPGIGAFQTSNGKSWKKLSRVPDDPIAFLGTTGKGVIAAGPFSPMHLGNAKGSSWTKVSDISPGFNPVASMKSSGGALLILRGKGLYKVEDDNLEPVPLSRPLSSVFAELETPGVTLAGTAGGVFRSEDGKAWEDVTPASLGVPVTDFLRLPDNRIVLSSGGLGAFISQDNGKSWDPWNEGLGTANTMQSLLLDGKTVLAATENGLMQRAPESESLWQPAERGVPRETVFDLAVHDGRVWVASTSGVYSGKTGGRYNLVKGLEGRARDLSSDEESLLALVGGHIYLVGAKGKARDMGDVPKGAAPTSVALAAGKLWLGTTAGVYVHSNGSWKKAWIKDYEVIAMDPTPAGVRVVTSGAGTFYLK